MSPDTETIKSAQQGDSTAFAQVVDLVYGRIFQFALKFTGQRQDAEDIAQQSCIKLASAIGSYRFEAAFTTWLYSLVLNCARDWCRQQSRHRHYPIEPELLDSAAECAGESLIHLRQTLEKIDTMGEGFRETLVLVAGEGMSHSEAAALLGVKESTISWRIHQIRKRIHQMTGTGAPLVQEKLQ